MKYRRTSVPPKAVVSWVLEPKSSGMRVSAHYLLIKQDQPADKREEHG